MSEEVVIYSEGLCHLSVCALKDLAGWRVAEKVNTISPSGVNPWSVSDENFRTGESNPCECPDNSARRHWLLAC